MSAIDRGAKALQQPACRCLVCLIILVGFFADAATAQPREGASRAGNRVAAPATEVILLRGLFNIFSLGMDELGHKLKAQRSIVTVSNHAEWRSIAAGISARRRAGEPPRRLVLIGHSLGANDIFSLANDLARAGVGVDLMIPIDATAPAPVPANVRRVVNYFQSGNGFGSVVVAGAGFRGSLVNADLTGNRRDLAEASLGHTTIDKSSRIHREIIMLVAGLSRPARRQR